MSAAQTCCRLGASLVVFHSPCSRSGASRVWWSGDVSGARLRHLQVRVVSRFSALQRACKNIYVLTWRQMRAFSFRFCNGVVRPCGCCPAPAAATAQRPVPARFLAGSWPVPVAGSWPVPGQFLAGSWPVPAQRPVPARFLPGSSCPAAGCFLAGSWPVPGRFLPDSRAASASVGRLLRRSRARGWAAQPSTGCTAGTLSLSGHGCCTTLVALCADASCVRLYLEILESFKIRLGRKSC